MDHRHVEESQIADDYLRDKLSAEERAQFEEHFIECAECLDRLEITEYLRRGLRSVAAEEMARSGARSQAGPPGWMAWLSPGWQAALLGGALVLLVVLPASFYLREIRRLRHELEQAKTASAQSPAPSPIPSEPGRSTAGTGEEQPQAGESKSAAPPLQLPPNPQSEPEAQTKLADELRRLRQPQINTPIFVLSAVRGAGEKQSQPINELVVSRAAEWMVFSLELEGRPEYQTYRATVSTADGHQLWSKGGLRPNRYDALTISFNSLFFRAGDYLLVLEGLTSAGQPVAVANYPFRIVKKNS